MNIIKAKRLPRQIQTFVNRGPTTIDKNMISVIVHSNVKGCSRRRFSKFLAQITSITVHKIRLVGHSHCTGYTLTHWGRVTHICVGKLTIVGSDNGLSPERRQAIIWTNAGILLIGPLGTNFSEILIEIQTFSLKKIRLKMSSAKCCSFRLGLNVLRLIQSFILGTVVLKDFLAKSFP